eukprot:Hpha_TRINITY_DN11526_c0_g2::TRINITY_DN11526_c0_g2_i1::g.32184::m.32184
MSQVSGGRSSVSISSSGSVSSTASNAPNPIKVVCRVRGRPEGSGPLESKRIQLDTAGGVVHLDSSEVRARLGAARGANAGAGAGGGGKISSFELDGLFDGQASQFDVYKTVGIPSVSTLLKGGGRTVTIISCGAEGTGKSYTLIGPNDGSALSLHDDNRGLVLRMVDSIFNRLSQQAGADGGVSVEISQVLITPEDGVIDLLPPSAGEYTRGAELRTCPMPPEGIELPPSLQWQTVFGGRTAVLVSGKDEAVGVLDVGLRRAGKQRGDRATIVKVMWQSRGRGEQSSQLLVVDCAPVYTKAMHNLRDVVGYLANDTGGRATVPYSKSKLTRLLKGDLSLSSSNTTRLIVHVKLSDHDLDVFDSSSILQFASTARRVKRMSSSDTIPPTLQSRSTAGARSASVPAMLAPDPHSLKSPKSMDGSPPHRGLAGIASPPPVAERPGSAGPPPLRGDSSFQGRSGGDRRGSGQGRTPQSLPRSRDAQGRSREGAQSPSSLSSHSDASSTSSQRNVPSSVGSGASQSSQMLASYLQSLTSQLREKEEQYRQAMGEVEKIAGLLQRERERTTGLKQRSSDQDNRLRELEMVTRSKADRFVCHRCNQNPYLDRMLARPANADDADVGDGEGPLSAPAGMPVGLLIPLPRERSPEAAGRRSPTPGRTSPTREGRRSPSHRGEQSVTDRFSDSSSSEGETPSTLSREQDMQSLSSGGDDSLVSDERHSERLRLGQAAPAPVQQLQRQLEAYKERYRRAKTRLRKALKAHAYERERVQDMNGQIEDAERQKQDLISKCIAASSKLEENKRWLRRVKKSLQAEKEENLDSVNDQWRQQITQLQRARSGSGSARGGNSAEEQSNSVLRETVQSLKTMVGHLSAEYNRRVGEMLARQREGRPPLEDDTDDRSRMSADDLRLENDALRGNVASLMKVMEDCYAENSHLASLSNRLSSRLGEANDRILSLEASWDRADNLRLESYEEERQRRDQLSPNRRVAGAAASGRLVTSPTVQAHTPGRSFGTGAALLTSGSSRGGLRNPPPNSARTSRVAL